MLSDAIECVAEYERALPLGIVERLNSKVVTRTDKSPPPTVPYGKCKIAEQVLKAILAPCAVRAEQQLDVSCAQVNLLAAPRQLINQIALTVDARVRDNPNVPVECERLMLVLGFYCGLQ